MSANSDGSPLRLLLRQDFHRYVQSLRQKLLISQKLIERPGKYYPSECGFIKSIFNFTVTSAGRQFDSFGPKFLDYIKFFESQQLEPTQNDVVWSYLGNWSGYLAEQP